MAARIKLPCTIIYPLKKTTKTFISKAAGSSGDFCWLSPAVSSTGTDAIATPKLGELRDLGKCQGDGEIPERCVLCCAVLSSSIAQVCEDTT